MLKKLVTSPAGSAPKLAVTTVFAEKPAITGSPERWKRAYEEKSQEGLNNSKPCPENP